MSKARELSQRAGVDGALSNRNVLINGGFTVSQRGDYTTAATFTTGTYWVDRWFADCNNSSALRSVVSVNLPELPSATKAARLEAGATWSGYLGVRQKLEFPENYVGKTYTYSAYVRSNSSNARLTLYAHGPGLIVASEPHSGNGGWERLSVTFAFSATAASDIYVDVFIASNVIGSVGITVGDYFEVTGVQLEVGDTATPFEHRSYGQELALYQRYAREYPINRLVMCPEGNNGDNTQSGIFFSPMRTAPTVTTLTTPSMTVNGVSSAYSTFYVVAGTSTDATVVAQGITASSYGASVLLVTGKVFLDAEL